MRACAGGTPRRIVVVGGGIAGQRCALELRTRGFEGRVTLVGAETVYPYDRTVLSKAPLCVDEAVEAPLLAPPSTYEDQGISLVLGHRAVGVSPRERFLILECGETLTYDRLVICSGARAAVPPALEHPGIHSVREFGDAVALREASQGASHLVVIGAGFIGCEVASAAARSGMCVTLLETQPLPLYSALGREVAALVADLHRREGVDLRCGAKVGRLEGAPSTGFVVHLNDGDSVYADLVMVGVGMVPAVSWLRSSPISIDSGIRTGARCETNLPGVLAAGDCAEWWSERAQQYVRAEHWDTAARHGRAAARAALGEAAVFDPLPFFWSDQYGVRMQMLGRVEGDNADVSGSGPDHFTARYYVRGDLVGVFAANEPGAIASARKELKARAARKDDGGD